MKPRLTAVLALLISMMLAAGCDSRPELPKVEKPPADGQARNPAPPQAGEQQK